MRLPSRLRLLRLLNLTPLLRRPLRVGLAVIAIGAGASLLCAVLVEEHSFNASVQAVEKKLAGPTPLRIVGPSSRGGIPDELVTTVRRVDGVQAAVPVVETVVRAGGPRGTTHVLALGVDCSVTAIIGGFQCSPDAIAHARAGQPPLVGTALINRLGRDAGVRTDLSRIPLAHAAALPQLDRLNGGLVAVFPLAQAQQEFIRPGQVDTVYVEPTPGTEVNALRHRLQQALPPQDEVLRASDPAPSTRGGNELAPLLGLIALVALAVAGMLVYNIMSLALAERRRELAISTALGATSRTTIGGVLVEATVLGALGGAVGAAAGVVIAYPLVDSLSQQAQMFSGIHVHVHVTALTLLAGPLIGAITASLAAWAPARRAARVDVAGELHARARADVEQARSLRRLAVLLVVGAISTAACYVASRHGATAPWQPPLGVAGLLVSTVAFLISAVLLAPLLVNLLRPWARRRGGLPDVAVRTLSAQPRRTGVAAAAVAAAVAFSTMLVTAIPAIDAVTVRLFRGVIDDRVAVSTLDFNNTAVIDSKTPPAVRARLARLPGVAAVDSTVSVIAPVDGQRTFVSAADGPVPQFTAVEGSVDAAALDRGDAFVGPALARSHHLHPGSVVGIDTAHGRVPVTVAAVWLDPNNIGNAITVGMPTMTRMFGPQPPSALFVRPAPGTSPTALAAQIRAAHLEPGLIVQTPDAWMSQLAMSVRQMMAPFWTLQKALLLVALIATLSTLLLVGVQRRHELGTLGALGLGPRGLATMTVVEAAVVGVTGCVLGIVGGILTGFSMLTTAVFTTGASPPFTLDPLAAAAYAGLALLVVVAGASWPAWRISRLQIVTALRHE